MTDLDKNSPRKIFDAACAKHARAMIRARLNPDDIEAAMRLHRATQEARRAYQAMVEAETAAIAKQIDYEQ